MTEMLYQPPLGYHEEGLDIQIEGQNLVKVSKFKYLCGTVSDNNTMNAELV